MAIYVIDLEFQSKTRKYGVKLWMDILIYFHLSLFTYERRMGIRVGRGTYNVLWIKNC